MQRDVFSRLIEARRHFILSVQENAELSPELAEKVCDYYLAKRWARMDVKIARMNIPHGSYLELPAIEHAVSQVH